LNQILKFVILAATTKFDLGALICGCGGLSRLIMEKIIPHCQKKIPHLKK